MVGLDGLLFTHMHLLTALVLAALMYILHKKSNVTNLTLTMKVPIMFKEIEL